MKELALVSTSNDFTTGVLSTVIDTSYSMLSELTCQVDLQNPVSLLILQLGGWGSSTFTRQGEGLISQLYYNMYTCMTSLLMEELSTTLAS